MLVNKLNNIERTIKYTYETKTSNILPFLDIMLNCPDNNLKLSVYQKSTNKNDLNII